MIAMKTDDSPHGRPSARAPGFTSLVLACAALAVTAGMWLVGWLPAIDRVSGDILLRSSMSRATDGQVAAVLIDDRSVERHGPLPWPRSRLARVVKAVRAAGSSAVAVDIVLTEATSPEEDLQLSDAFTGFPAVLAAAFDAEGNWLLPLDAFGGRMVAAHAYGEIGPDGVIRTIAATKQTNGLALPALSLAAARLRRPEIGITPGRAYRPEFRPAPQDVASFSAVDALEGRLTSEVLRGHLVFIGISATGAGDQFIVPTGPAHTPVPGVLAHASAAASILQNRLVRKPGAVWSLAAMFMLAFGVQLLRDRRGAFDLARFLILVAGVLLVSIVAAGIGLTLVPVAALTGAMVISALLRETVESRLAHRETGRLLQSMLAHAHTGTTPVPRTARGRLAALEDLQRRVLAEDATRQALLAGMGEGVVLWDRNGEVLETNPTAEILWGHVPSLDEMDDPLPGDGAPTIFSRGRRHLSVDLTELEFGSLAIIRDVSAERQLEQQRREMQRLVSHELKTPLASIAGFGETIERYELSGDELGKVASMIRGEAGRLQEMVTVFLDLERLGGGHWDDEVEPVDFDVLVESRLSVLEAAAARNGLGITSSIEPGCTTEGVPHLLDRVIDNLIGNALKYSESGSKIHVSVRKEEGRVVLSVGDHGPGIPGESVGKIFDRFYRVPGSQGSGAGLGLSLVKEVVDWHGGCITIDSTPGAGSTFTVSLPCPEEV